MNNNQPIGLIDSGIGGFTVLKELQHRMPEENIEYLGDSLRMPYGELDNEEIIAYANSDIRFLEARGVKAILLACNTVSSMVDSLTARVPLFSIVDAGCQATIETVPEGDVGLIATRATVNNNAYPRMLARLTDKVHFVQQGTKTLASVINNYPEEIELLRTHIHLAIDPLITERDIHVLLLGCTHFPIVRESIEAMYPQFTIINPAIKQIAILKDYLSKNGELTDQKGIGDTRIHTTGSVADFRIFADMVDYLDIDCERLERNTLDIDANRKVPAESYKRRKKKKIEAIEALSE
ncbi:MAG: glutamate racemase [Eubacteriaceae bacterium]|jgi:glutamate racemase|nr:glutamate racemase [Eubacteriaceae bacterium]MDD4507313.1 glutamate racemase [Eubacteriaceae bacterium]